MYTGRLFFRKDTGNLLYWYEMQGDILVPTIEQDLTAITPLQDYNTESIEVIELQEEDYETREKCRTATGIRLDLETNELIFDFTPQQIEEQQQQATIEQRLSEVEMAVAAIMGGAI